MLGGAETRVSQELCVCDSQGSAPERLAGTKKGVLPACLHQRALRARNTHLLLKKSKKNLKKSFKKPKKNLQKIRVSPAGDFYFFFFLFYKITR